VECAKTRHDEQILVQPAAVTASVYLAARPKMRECSFPLCGRTFAEDPLGRPLLAESGEPAAYRLG
jgi:hypothetical protein